jgi:hypothetical protein
MIDYIDMNHYIDESGTHFYHDGNNQLHRLDGPAIEAIDGYKAYWVENKLHRLDGPAIEYGDGDMDWYIDDEEIHCKDNEEFLRIVKMKSLL